jgi:hypothetical protein
MTTADSITVSEVDSSHQVAEIVKNEEDRGIPVRIVVVDDHERKLRPTEFAHESVFTTRAFSIRSPPQTICFAGLRNPRCGAGRALDGLTPTLILTSATLSRFRPPENPL